MSAELRTDMMYLNIADDYFKAKKMADSLSLDIENKDKEIYDLKHELIAAQIKAESSAKEIKDIDMIASIDVKKDEPGIKEFCERNRIEFVTYTADELMAVQGEFSASQFVREHVGVDNVCERAAVLAGSRECNKAGELIYKKHKYDSVTVAVARLYKISRDGD